MKFELEEYLDKSFRFPISDVKDTLLKVSLDFSSLHWNDWALGLVILLEPSPAINYSQQIFKN